MTPSSYEELPWWQEAGPSGVSPFPETTEYFGDSKQMWMVNFRVRDLDAMVVQLRAAGIAIEVARSSTRTGALPACTTLRAIPLSFGNQRGETLRVRLPTKRLPIIADSASFRS